MLGRHGGGAGEVPTKQELEFYAKSPGKLSKGFKQESNLLAFDLITVQRGYFNCWVEKGLQRSKLGRTEIRGLLQNDRQEKLVPWTWVLG